VPVVVAAAAAVPAAVAAAAPAVTVVGLTQTAVVVVSDLKVVAAEGSRPSARPGPEVRPP
jgi:predicted porin